MEQANYIKAIFTAVFAFLSALLGVLAVPVILLVACNLIDYATGLMASKYRAVVTQKSRTRSTLRLPENQMSRSHRKFLPVNGAMETTERIVYQLPGMTTIRFRIS